MDQTRILFVCLGNICRSPAAEGIMKYLVEKEGREDEFFIDSAGIGGWHIGQLPDNRMRRHGKLHGYNFNSRARQFQRDDFDRFDIIIGMDHENLSDIRWKARCQDDIQKIHSITEYLRHHPGHHSVPDPYYGDDGCFELVIELLEDACQGLLDALKE